MGCPGDDLWTGAPAPIPFQFGDLNCPLCGEALDIITQQSADGAEQAGFCAACMTITEID